MNSALAQKERVAESLQGSLAQLSQEQFLRKAPEIEAVLEALEADIHGSSDKVPLRLRLLDLRDSLLQDWGPSTHPGLNHLWALAQGSMPGEWDRVTRFESLRTHVWEESPKFLQDEQAQFEGDYREFLTLSPSEPGWLDAFHQLGQAFARIDLSYLERQSRQGPTGLPWLDLTVQVIWQESQGYLSPHLLDQVLSASLMQCRELMSISDPDLVRTVSRLESLLLSLFQGNGRFPTLEDFLESLAATGVQLAEQLAGADSPY